MGRVHQNYFRDYDPAVGKYVESDPIGLLAGVNTYNYVDESPVGFFDPDGLGKEGGRRSVAGNDPLTPREINRNSPKSVVDKQIEIVKDALKRMPGMNPKRAAQLRAWLKVAGRGFTKAFACPPLLEDFARAMAKEQCLVGDVRMCQVYLDLGGELDTPAL